MTLTSIGPKIAVNLAVGLFSAQTALAQVTVPTITGGVDGVDDGDLFGILSQLASKGLTILLFVVSIAAFIIVGWSVVSKFNECRAGRAEWSEALVTAGIGVVVIVFSTFLLSQTESIFASNGGAGGGGGFF